MLPAGRLFVVVVFGVPVLALHLCLDHVKMVISALKLGSSSKISLQLSKYMILFLSWKSTITLFTGA